MSSLRILVVDDDRDFNEGLATLLSSRGHHVESAFGGSEAVDKYRDAAFDVALIDVQMPGMNGVESFLALREIRPAARVIMMTGYSVEQLLEQAVQGGAWGVLHKPFNPQQVLEMIDCIRPRGVLIADDDRDFVASLEDALKHHGYRVLIAPDGPTALELVRADGVDLLILDLRLPLMSGIEVYHQLNRSGNAVPTIIVTAFADQELDAMGTLKSQPVAGILTKPFDPRQLVELIEKNTAGVC